MSARTIGWIIALLVALAAAGVAWLFWVQNSSRKIMLSLNLGLMKLELAEPVPAPVLVAVCFGIGVVVGGALIGGIWASSRSSARRQRERAALGNDDASTGWR